MACDIWGSLRSSASSSAMVWSACSSTQKVGTFVTRIPLRVQAATSILSVPAPRREMTRQRLKLSMTPSGSAVETTKTASQSEIRGTMVAGALASASIGSRW